MESVSFLHCSSSFFSKTRTLISLWTPGISPLLLKSLEGICEDICPITHSVHLYLLTPPRDHHSNQSRKARRLLSLAEFVTPRSLETFFSKSLDKSQGTSNKMVCFTINIGVGQDDDFWDFCESTTSYLLLLLIGGSAFLLNWMPPSLDTYKRKPLLV